MPGVTRNKNNVSLPKLACLEPPERKSARQIIKTFTRAGEGDAPPLERLVHAHGAARLEKFTETDASGHETAKTRIRLDEGVLARLRDRGQLDRSDKALNAALAAAGEKYREDFYRAGLDPLRSADLTSEIHVAFTPDGLWRSEAQLLHLQKFNAAREKIPEDFRDALKAVVLEDRDLVEVGRDIGAYRDAKMACAVALFILRRGLTALARHYRLLPG